MYHNILFWLVTGVVLYELCKAEMEMAGNSSTEPAEIGKAPKNGAAFRANMQGLDESIYEIFERAFNYQTGGQYNYARKEYNKLRKVRHNTLGTIDLAKYSPELKYNLDLLDRQEAAQKGRR